MQHPEFEEGSCTTSRPNPSAASLEIGCSTSRSRSRRSRRSSRAGGSLDSLPSDPAPLNRIPGGLSSGTSLGGGLSSGAAGRLGAVQGDGIAGIDSLDMAVMGRGLSHALGDQPMSMSIDDIGFSERG